MENSKRQMEKNKFKGLRVYCPIFYFSIFFIFYSQTTFFYSQTTCMKD